MRPRIFAVPTPPGNSRKSPVDKMHDVASRRTRDGHDGRLGPTVYEYLNGNTVDLAIDVQHDNVSERFGVVFECLLHIGVHVFSLDLLLDEALCLHIHGVRDDSLLKRFMLSLCLLSRFLLALQDCFEPLQITTDKGFVQRGVGHHDAPHGFSVGQELAPDRLWVVLSGLCWLPAHHVLHHLLEELWRDACSLRRGGLGIGGLLLRWGLHVLWLDTLLLWLWLLLWLAPPNHQDRRIIQSQGVNVARRRDGAAVKTKLLLLGRDVELDFTNNVESGNWEREIHFERGDASILRSNRNFFD